MKDTFSQFIEKSYREYLPKVRTYILYKTRDEELARDLAQDVFVRLLEYEHLLCEETVRSFIYTIARNIVIDHLRRHQYRTDMTERIMGNIENETWHTPEREMETRDLLAAARHRLQAMPPQRRTIFVMRHFEEKSAREISEKLHLSVRTVENHIFIGNKEMRAYIKQCI